MREYEIKLHEGKFKGLKMQEKTPTKNALLCRKAAGDKQELKGVL